MLHSKHIIKLPLKACLKKLLPREQHSVGPHLAHTLISLCRLCHIFAKGGPHLVGTIWAIFTIYHMGYFRVTFRLHIAVNTTSLPTEGHM